MQSLLLSIMVISVHVLEKTYSRSIRGDYTVCKTDDDCSDHGTKCVQKLGSLSTCQLQTRDHHNCVNHTTRANKQKRFVGLDDRNFQGRALTGYKGNYDNVHKAVLDFADLALGVGIILIVCVTCICCVCCFYGSRRN